jgi:hypothetical protein
VSQVPSGSFAASVGASASGASASGSASRSRPSPPLLRLVAESPS